MFKQGAGAMCDTVKRNQPFKKNTKNKKYNIDPFILFIVIGSNDFQGHFFFHSLQCSHIADYVFFSYISSPHEYS